VFAQDVGVDAQGHGGVGVAEAAGYDVNGDSGEKQRDGAQVAQIVQAGMEWGGRRCRRWRQAALQLPR